MLIIWLQNTLILSFYISKELCCFFTYVFQNTLIDVKIWWAITAVLCGIAIKSTCLFATFVIGSVTFEVYIELIQNVIVVQWRKATSRKLLTSLDGLKLPCSCHVTIEIACLLKKESLIDYDFSCSPLYFISDLSQMAYGGKTEIKHKEIRNCIKTVESRFTYKCLNFQECFSRKLRK